MTRAKNRLRDALILALPSDRAFSRKEVVQQFAAANSTWCASSVNTEFSWLSATLRYVTGRAGTYVLTEAGRSKQARLRMAQA